MRNSNFLKKFIRYLRSEKALSDLTNKIASLSREVELLSANQAAADETRVAVNSSLAKIDEKLIKIIERSRVSDALSEYYGKDLCLYLDSQGIPSLAFANSHPNRVMILSLPKAGTYFVAEILKTMGFVFSECHFGKYSFTDFRFRSKAEMVANAFEYRKDIPFSTSSQLIGNGQFGVGHLAHQAANIASMHGMKLIFLRREQRMSLLSLMRFYQNEGRGEEYGVAWKDLKDNKKRMSTFLKLYIDDRLKGHKKMLGWIDEPGVLSLAFEDLSGENGVNKQKDMLQRLCRHLDTVDLPPDVIDNVKQTETKTRSKIKVQLNDYWSPESEELFAQYGGKAINRALGYAE